MRPPPRVTLFMPVLNEIVGLRALAPAIPRDICHQVLVVDGGSSDGTLEFAQSLGYQTYRQQRPGLRHAYIEAWPLVTGDIVITFSPDGNCPPDGIPKLVEAMRDGADMVVASRYFAGARSDDDDVVTAFGNWMFTRLINTLHGGRYTDAMGIFRAYHTRLFTELALDREDAYRPERWMGTVLGIEPLLSVRAAKRRLRIEEIGVPEPRRIGGDRKLQVIRWGGGYLLQVMREVYFWR